MFGVPAVIAHVPSQVLVTAEAEGSVFEAGSRKCARNGLYSKLMWHARANAISISRQSHMVAKITMR